MEVSPESGRFSAPEAIAGDEAVPAGSFDNGGTFLQVNEVCYFQSLWLMPYMGSPQKIFENIIVNVLACFYFNFWIDTIPSVYTGSL